MHNFENMNTTPNLASEHPEVENIDIHTAKKLGQNALSNIQSERVVDSNLEHADVSAGAIDAISTLEQSGFEAYLVGGFVRDALLGKIPKDEDITTSATPAQVTQIFENHNQKVVPSGIQFGTVTVLDKNDSKTGYEITTYRTDGASSDGRHPDEIAYADTLIEDLARRDFTMNAIAFNPLTSGENRVIDPYGGISDLENSIIRSVGNPEQRISEDKLRMMRAVRFAAQKDMTIDSALADAIKTHSAEINGVSGERIGGEITKILLSDHPEKGLAAMHELGLLSVILPEVSTLYQVEQRNPWHIYNAGQHTEKVVESSPKNFHVRLAALFHDVGKAQTQTMDANGVEHFIGHDEASVEMARAAMKRLRFKREDIDRTCKLIALHDKEIQPTEEGVCRFIERHQDVNPDEFEELIALKLADNAAQNPEKTPPRIAGINQSADIYREIVANRPYRIRDLALNGRDVMQINETRRGEKVQLKGTAVGIALQKMLSYVLRHPEKNTVADLTDFLRGNLKSIYHESRS